MVPVDFRFSDKTIQITVKDKPSLLNAIEERFSKKEGFALATMNLDHLVKLRASPEYRTAYSEHDFISADGNPVVWLSHLAQRPVELVTGSDSMFPLLELAAKYGINIGFFGSMPDVLEEASRRLRHEIPGLRVVWIKSPEMGFQPTAASARAAIREMQAADVQMCIISLSAPRQEMFSAFARRTAPEIGFCCFGASLDFVAGRQVRAPQIVRALALEWLWRAMSAPRRLVPRYIACAMILPSLALQAMRSRDADSGKV